MKDINGTIIAIGDKVHFTFYGGSDINVGIVTKIDSKNIYILPREYDGEMKMQLRFTDYRIAVL